MVPVAFTFRVLPLGQDVGFQPYLGGGLGVINWRYSESGQFVDTRDRSIFNNSYAASGTETGPVAMGGIRFAGDTARSGFEIRYQAAESGFAAAVCRDEDRSWRLVLSLHRRDAYSVGNDARPLIERDAAAFADARHAAA